MLHSTPGSRAAGSAFAWVESPLQLLGAVEYAAATGSAVRIVPRAGAAQLEATIERLERMGLPPGVEVLAERSTPVPALVGGERHWLLGDVFSGHSRLALSLASPDRLTVVDDGAISLHLDRVLAGEGAFGRPGVRESMVVRGLAAGAHSRLLALASADALELFSCFPLRSSALVPHRFSWLRKAAAPQAPRTDVVLGSAAVTDSRVTADAYLRFIDALERPIAYFPHRREPDDVLARLARLRGVRIERTGLPIELVLAGAERARVRSLPSSALSTLPHVLAGTGSRFERLDLEGIEVRA